MARISFVAEKIKYRLAILFLFFSSRSVVVMVGIYCIGRQFMLLVYFNDSSFHLVKWIYIDFLMFLYCVMGFWLVEYFILFLTKIFRVAATFFVIQLLSNLPILYFKSWGYERFQFFYQPKFTLISQLLESFILNRWDMLLIALSSFSLLSTEYLLKYYLR